MTTLDEHVPLPPALPRPRVHGARLLTVCAGALAVAVMGVVAGRAVAPEPHAQAAPAPDLALGQQLPRVLATLGPARVRGRAQLREARTPSGQAQAARHLASAHGAAAAALRPIAGASALARRVSSTERAYAGLARAARAGPPARFAAARRGVDKAEADLARALASPLAPQPPAARATASAESAATSVATLALAILVCGLAAAGVVAAAPARRRARSADASEITGWSCEISWAANVRSAGFRATATAPGQRPRVIARSPNITWPPLLPPTPDEEELLAAARTLVHALRAAGWTPTTRGPRWYAQRFDWTGEGDPEPLSA